MGSECNDCFIPWHLLPRKSSQHLPETDVVAVEILNAELTHSIPLRAWAVIHPGSAGFHLFVKCVGIVHPEVSVPRFVPDLPERHDLLRVIHLRQHQVVSIAMADAEVRRIAVELFEMKPNGIPEV